MVHTLFSNWMESEMEVMEIDSIVGFRFKPTNEEIICLLKMKRLDPDFTVDTVKEIDFYSFDPWELPWHAGIQSKESVWYFYCKPYNFKNSKYSKSRKTKSGGWKINGKGSQMLAKNSKVVIGSKKILSFSRRGTNSKKAKAEWVMHEIHIEDNPLYKEDFVVCRLERRRVNKPSISSSDDSESSHLVVTVNQVISSSDDSESSHLVEQLPSHHLTSDISALVAEHSFPTVESMLSAQLDALQEFNGLDCNSLPALQSPIDVGYVGFSGCNGLDHNSFSAQKSPINPEQITTTYFDGSSNYYNVLDFQFDKEQEDLNSQGDFQGKYPLVEAGDTLSPRFNSSQWVTEVHFVGSSFTNAETFNSLVNGYSPTDSGDCYIDSIWNHD